MTRYPGMVKMILSLLIAAVAVYFSVYIRSLDKVMEERQMKSFKPAEYARYYWNNILVSEAMNAISARELIDLLKKNPDAAFNRYGKTMGISDMSNFLIKDRGKVILVSDDFIELSICNSQINIRLKTGLVFGNVLRDCTGKINMDDFKTSMDFNNISVEINQIVNTEIIPELKQKAITDELIFFEGAAGVMKGTTDSLILEVIPIRITIIDEC